MIISTYPDLNDKWLLTGEGPMLRTPIEKTVPEVTPDTGKPFFGDLPASAGNIIQYPDITRQLPTGSINIPQARGAKFFFPVIGMSMRPTIEEGDIIGVCHIDRYETTNAERVYMIITCDNERMIKRILGYNKERGTITLASDNPQYPNFDLDTSLIVDIYKVVLHLKIETL
jgi:phage repressor protein C with HTH and peptisase S24 domain